MACDADIDARPRPIANKDTATIFMVIPFCWYAMKMFSTQYAFHLTNGGDASDGGANADASADASGHDASALLPA